MKNKVSYGFVFGVLASVVLFTSMGQMRLNENAGRYHEAIQAISAEIALYEFGESGGDAATQQARLARIKKYAAAMDAYRQ